jgi:peroxin-1
MHVQVNRLPRDARLGSLKERFRDWLDEAKLRRPCVLLLDDLDTMLGPESEVGAGLNADLRQLAQSIQPEIIANTFADLLTALPPNSGIFVIATALGEDSLHPVLAARHTFGQVVKLKSLGKESRGKVSAD